jgi:hypothetical protein
VTGKTAVKASTGSPYGLGDQTTTKGPTPSEAAGALMDGAQ